jgi:uncharacterized protein YneF (UPF0154 family)
MMRAILTVLGLLIGPFAGFYGSYPVFHAIYYKGCMTGFTVLIASLMIGAPLGAVVFAVVGFWLGYRLDKRAKQRQLDDEEDLDAPCQEAQASQ